MLSNLMQSAKGMRWVDGQPRANQLRGQLQCLRHHLRTAQTSFVHRAPLPSSTQIFTISVISLKDSGYESLDALERDTIRADDACDKGYNGTRGNRN